eukprot:jgi/Bigna1/91026/estExt_fgenesh1_pg.C_860029
MNNFAKYFSSGAQHPEPNQEMQRESKTPELCRYPPYLVKGWTKSENYYTAQGTIKITGEKGGEIDIGKQINVYFLLGHIQHDQSLGLGDAVIVRYHKYSKGKYRDYKACDVRRDPKFASVVQSSAKEKLSAGFKHDAVQFVSSTVVDQLEGASHCINTKGRISRISEPPKDFGFIVAEIPVGFDLRSVDLRPAKSRLTAGMVVHIDFNIDSHGKLYTEHIVALKEERLQGKSYSEGVIDSINPHGYGTIMADVAIYYKIHMIPDAKLLDVVSLQAKIVSQGRLSAVSVSRTSCQRRRTSVSPRKTRHSSISPRSAKNSRSSPNRSPARCAGNDALQVVVGRIKKVQSGVIAVVLFKGDGVSDKELACCSTDKCDYENPVVGDFVRVEYGRAQKEFCRIQRMQKILTKIGKVKSVGPDYGFITVKAEEKDVYFERNCCQIMHPVKGETVQVSYIHSRGLVKALHICNVQRQPGGVCSEKTSRKSLW